MLSSDCIAIPSAQDGCISVSSSSGSVVLATNDGLELWMDGYIVVYTDGALEGDGSTKGVGAVLYQLPMQTPLYFGEELDLAHRNFDHIAPIEMHAIFRMLQLFGHLLRDRAVLLFVDNTHAIGCLLKRSATVRERGHKRDSSGKVIQLNPTEHTPYTHFQSFCALEIGLRRTMNEQARAIWELVSNLNILLWLEYGPTDCNIADPPSRNLPMPVRAIHISESHRLFAQDDWS